MTDRDFQIHMARVLLSDCQTRRHWPASRNFYWIQFDYAQRCRKAAAAMTEIKQWRLFG